MATIEKEVICDSIDQIKAICQKLGACSIFDDGTIGFPNLLSDGELLYDLWLHIGLPAQKAVTLSANSRTDKVWIFDGKYKPLLKFWGCMRVHIIKLSNFMAALEQAFSDENQPHTLSEAAEAVFKEMKNDVPHAAETSKPKQAEAAATKLDADYKLPDELIECMLQSAVHRLSYQMVVDAVMRGATSIQAAINQAVGMKLIKPADKEARDAIVAFLLKHM